MSDVVVASGGAVFLRILDDGKFRIVTYSDPANGRVVRVDDQSDRLEDEPGEGFYYLPDAGFVGSDTVVVTEFATGPGGSGGGIVSEVTLDITVAPDPGVPPGVGPAPDLIPVLPGSARAGFVAGFPFAPQVFGGVDLFENDPFGVFVVAIVPQDGLTVDYGPGIIASVPVPAGAAPGDEFEVEYIASVQGFGLRLATATVRVAPEGSVAPVAGDDVVTAVRGTPLAIPVATLLANDTDANGGPLTVVGTSYFRFFDDPRAVLADGVVTLTPPADFVGQTTFSYVVSDADGFRAVGDVTVNVVPPPGTTDPIPLTTEEGEGVRVEEYDTRFEGPEAASDPANGTVFVDSTTTRARELFYVPDAGFVGTDEFTVSTYLSIPGNPVERRETRYVVTVAPDSDDPDGPAPTDDLIVLPAAAAGTTLAIRPFELARNDGDAAVGGVEYRPDLEIDGDTSVISLGIPADAAPGTEIAFRYLALLPAFPAAPEYRAATVTVRLAAAGEDAPVGGDDVLTVAPGAPAPTVSVTSLLANDRDPEGGPLTFAGLVPGNQAILSEAGGVISFDPIFPFQPPLTFSYLVPDAAGLTDEVSVTVRVAEPPADRGPYVRGAEGADNLDFSRWGASEPVQAAGVGGDDTIRGGAGDDALNGGAGRDNLLGGAGRDLITGGEGADRVAGGAGDDKFVFLAGDLARAAGGAGAVDTILDFAGAGAAGGDLIEFRGLGAGATLAFVREVGPAGGTQQLYRVTYDADGAAGPGGPVGFDLQVNMAGGSVARLTTADYAFLAA